MDNAQPSTPHPTFGESEHTKVFIHKYNLVK